MAVTVRVVVLPAVFGAVTVTAMIWLIESDFGIELG